MPATPALQVAKPICRMHGTSPNAECWPVAWLAGSGIDGIVIEAVGLGDTLALDEFQQAAAG